MNSVHYCIWGSCTSGEYCCGDNVCCKETNFDSLLLTVIIFGVLTALAFCCLCFYCSTRRMYVVPFFKKYLKTSYTFISTQRDIKSGSMVNQDSTTKDCMIRVDTTKVSV